MASDLVLCLDSGTTSVKAAIYDRTGCAVARVEFPNSALERDGHRVEQDMNRTFDDAVRAIAACVEQVSGNIAALALTAQGDGLWPVANDMTAAGKALTWLDGRAKIFSAEMPAALDTVEAITSSRPTAASATLQLLWLQQNDPSRFAAIRYALRLKEWLFFRMTGALVAEPGSVLPSWGDWHSGLPNAEVSTALGLEKGIELLPEIRPISGCVAGLTSDAAARVGLPVGTPVVLGPGDVQSSFVGLGVGPGLSMSRASIFGTSAIHGRYYESVNDIPKKLSGAMVQRFATGEGFICFHPCFNGGTTFTHVANVFGGTLPKDYQPAYSGLIMQPFFESGGERAPFTDPRATAAVFGIGSTTRTEDFAWASREALAFLARMSHADLGDTAGQGVAVGGGVARDRQFLQLLANVLGRPVRPHVEGDAALRGLAAIAMGALEGGAACGQTHQGYLAPSETEILPDQGPVRAYLDRKFDLFRRLLEDAAEYWEELAQIEKEAEGLKAI